MSSYAYFALVRLHIAPSVFLDMDRQEQAFIIASIKEYAENAKQG